MATHGNLAAAASEVHLTPSALSHALKALETDLSVRLFDRVANRLVLNQAGEHLLSQIREPLEALERAAHSVKALNTWGLTKLRIGAASSICERLLPRVFKELRREFPKLALHLESGEMPELLRMLRTSQIDLAIGHEPEGAPDLEKRRIFEDELLFVFSPLQISAKASSNTLQEISRYPLLMSQRDTRTASLVEDYFNAHQIKLEPTLPIASLAAIKEMVKLKLGVAVLAPWIVEHEIGRGVLLTSRLGSKPLRRQWAVVHLSRKRLNLQEEKFCKLCRTQAMGMRLDHGDLPSKK